MRLLALVAVFLGISLLFLGCLKAGETSPATNGSLSAQDQRELAEGLAAMGTPAAQPSANFSEQDSSDMAEAFAELERLGN